MKTRFSIVVAVFFLTAVQAKAQTVMIQDTALTGNTNTTLIYSCTVYNNSCIGCGGQSVTVHQFIDSADLPAGWSITICNPNGCFGSRTTSNTFVIPATTLSEVARFEIHEGPNAGAGLAKVRFAFGSDTTGGVSFTLTGMTEGFAAVEPGGDDERGASVSQNYPNPSLGSTTVNYHLNAPEGMLIISDVQGKEVGRHPLAGSSSSVTLQGQLPAGSYFYSLYDGTKLAATRQMIVQ